MRVRAGGKSYEGDSCLRNVTGRGRHRLRAPPRRTGRREHSGAGTSNQCPFLSRALKVGVHAAHVTCQEWGAGLPEPNAGGTAGILIVDIKQYDPVPEYDFVRIPGRDFLMPGIAP